MNARRASSETHLPLRNDQFALLALLMLGGEMEAVDTEDVAIKVDDLAPGRFRWRKFKEHIDLGLVRNGLQDSRKKQLVIGGAVGGWRLTVNGAQEAKQLAEQNAATANQPRLTPEQKQWRTRERERLVRDPAFRTAQSVGPDTVPDADILRFFKFDEYLPADRRVDRIHRLLVAFEGDAEVHDVVEQFARRLKL